MDVESLRKLLVILIDNASRILRAQFGVDRAETTFFDIIELLREEPALRHDFLALVENTLERHDPSGLGQGYVPRELTELAVHELRWPEFQKLAEARIQRVFGGDAALAISDVASSISEAYRNDWEDREFYRRYGA
ncbi:MAG: hypothetical protein ABIO40_04695 [Devosia sp.]